jgi:hypothetical protein
MNEIELAAVRTGLQATLAHFSARPITCPADQLEANTALSWAKTRLKLLKDTLSTFTKPHRDAEAKVRAWFKPGIADAEAVETLIKRRLADYALAQVVERQAQLEAASVAFQAGQVEAGVQALAAVPEPVKLAGTSERLVWKWEVLDPAKVPATLCSPDAGKIAGAVQAGARDIPGVRVWQDVQIAHRVSK